MSLIAKRNLYFDRKNWRLSFEIPTEYLQETERSFSIQHCHKIELVLELMPQLCYLIAEFSDNSPSNYVRQINV
jgi:hypothetical protein